MLIHYFSSPRNDINEALRESVKQGFLPAYQFAAINDFNALYGKFGMMTLIRRIILKLICEDNLSDYLPYQNKIEIINLI